MTAASPIRALTAYTNRIVFVVGLGKSGMSAAHALKAGGASVHCWDDGEAARNKAAAEGFTLTDPSKSLLLAAAEALILAPGIPLTHPAPHPSVVAAKAAGVPMLGDIELLYRAEPDATYIGITGTNGKSTTTALIGHMLTRAGVDVAVGGNLGTAALTLPKASVYVLEMSSYQLDLTVSPMFDIAVLLNITPDHLDRHGGMDGYIQAKERILRPHDDDSTAIIGTDTPETAEIANRLLTDGRNIVRIAKDSRPVADLIDSGACPALAGDHNKQNAAAAYAVGRALGLDEETILDGIRSFPGLAHRQERIATLDGIVYINDSKATNADAAARALSAFDGIYWIAGGREKDGGYADLDPYLPHVRHAFLIGEAMANMAAWIAQRVPVTLSGTLADAVAAAHTAATKDGSGTVLLSPACASFDQYPNFEIRGDAFRDLVLALPATARIVHSTREAA